MQFRPFSYRDLPGFENLAGLAYTSPYPSQSFGDTNDSRTPVGKIAAEIPTSNAAATSI
jgi:hypothetical protein